MTMFSPKSPWFDIEALVSLSLFSMILDIKLSLDCKSIGNSSKPIRDLEQEDAI